MDRFPLAALVAMAKPASNAKYLQFRVLLRSAHRDGAKLLYPWPYLDGVTLAEAANDLALVVTAPTASRSPSRWAHRYAVHLPWKYGFKSVKSIVRLPSPTSAARLLSADHTQRLRLLGKRQSGRPASPLGASRESATSPPAKDSDAPVQRLRRIRRRLYAGRKARRSISKNKAGREGRQFLPHVLRQRQLFQREQPTSSFRAGRK